MVEDHGTSENSIGDSEILYRSVRPTSQEIYYDEFGTLRVSPQAFADRSRLPSLFRHDLCDAPPLSNPPRLGLDQAVVFLTAGEIREKAGPIEHKAEGTSLVTYLIDVRPDTENQH
jgi:hypothetical protein